MERERTIKVGGTTNVRKLATSVSKYWESHVHNCSGDPGLILSFNCSVVLVGANALNQAVKGVITANNEYLLRTGWRLLLLPSFETDEENFSYIKLRLVPENI